MQLYEDPRGHTQSNPRPLHLQGPAFICYMNLVSHKRTGYAAFSTKLVDMHFRKLHNSVHTKPLKHHELQSSDVTGAGHITAFARG